MSLLAWAVLVLAIPAGWGAAICVRRLSGTAEMPSWAGVGGTLCLALWTCWVMPPDFLLPLTAALGWMLLVLAGTDAAAQRLPDIFTLPLAAAGLVASLWLPDMPLADHAIGAALGLGVFAGLAWLFKKLRGREGLGLGDAKLAGAAGAWLGWQGLPSVVLIACVLAFAWVLVRAALRGRDSIGSEIAFGVPLCAAFWLVWLYGPLALG